MKKLALFAFNGEAMCFMHVLLNALDMHAKGAEVQLILEGASVKLIPQLDAPGSPVATLWQRTVDAGLVAGACKACAATLGTLEAARERNIPLLDDVSGHPGMHSFINRGFTVITF